MRLGMRLLVPAAGILLCYSGLAAQSTAQTNQPQVNELREQTSDSKQTPKQEEAVEVPATESDIDPKLRKALASPRATMQTFLDAMSDSRREEAVLCLDQSQVTATEEARKTKELELAHKLKEILDKLVQVEFERYPDEAEPDAKFTLFDTHDIEETDREIAERIVIAQCEDGLWRFHAETIASIEELHENLLERDLVPADTLLSEPEEPADVPFAIRLSEQFPVEFRKTYILLPGYQWICLVAILLLGVAADRLTRRTLDFLMKIWFRLRHKSRAPVIRGMWRPVGLFMQGLTWYIATKFIGLPTFVLTVLLIGLKYFAVVAGVWMSFHLIDLASRVATRRTSRTSSRFDDLLVPLLSKSLKIVATCLGIVVCINAFDWEVTGLLGGLGIGGMALAFASQDAIGNVFGSLTVLMDRPFEIGDWIVAGEVEGTVETVGFRSTRVRTFHNSLITIPNSRFTTSVVDNMGRRHFRRFKTSIGVQYDTTPDQLDAFCEGIRELIRRHPYTRKDYYHVYFNDFNDSSLNILLYCFFECSEWSTELRERHRLLIDTMKLAKRLHIQFAFPTRTLHMLSGDKTDSDQPQIDWSDPGELGVREAVQVAGPILSDDDRPGDVEFPQPAQL